MDSVVQLAPIIVLAVVVASGLAAYTTIVLSMLKEYRAEANKNEDDLRDRVHATERLTMQLVEKVAGMGQRMEKQELEIPRRLSDAIEATSRIDERMKVLERASMKGTKP